MKTALTSIAVAAALMVGTPALAQDGTKGGAAAGAAAGAIGGAIIGGPVGFVIGGVAGAVGGASVGAIASDDQVYIRDYVYRQPAPANVIVREPLVVGKPLPGTVQVYDIDGNPRVTGYRYAYVNNSYVLVDRNGLIVGTVVR